MFKIVVKKDLVQLEMSPEELNLAIRIASYINDNFIGSDFFTIADVSQKELVSLLSELKQAQNLTDSRTEPLALNFNKEQYRIFEEIFLHGRRFLDEIEEFESEYNQIEIIADVISPPQTLINLRKGQYWTPLITL